MDTHFWHPARLRSTLAVWGRVAMAAALLLCVAIVAPVLMCFYGVVAAVTVNAVEKGKMDRLAA